MENFKVTPSGYDFSAVDAAMRRYVDQNILPGVSYAVLQGRNVIDLNCVGWADKEQQIPLRTDHLFRAFSNTKLVTSCAVLLLMEEGRLDLDDPVESYIPQLGNRRVLKPGATSLDDTELAHSSITIRHLLSHSSGLSYGLLDPGSMMYKAYTERQLLSPAKSLADMVDALADLPLAFHPGTSWEYSVASDVLARLIEIVSSQRFDVFLKERIFDPLGMKDTSFVIPPSEHDRLVVHYFGADITKPLIPGLTRTDFPYPGAYLNPVPKLSGGGGLVTSLSDMVALLSSLLPGDKTLLKQETISLMMTNQLPKEVFIRFAHIGEIIGKGHGLAGAVTLTPSPFDPPETVGEIQWGGIAGTHWWIAPQANLSGVVMTQRHMAFWHPFFFEFKKLVFDAVRQTIETSHS